MSKRIHALIIIYSNAMSLFGAGCDDVGPLVQQLEHVATDGQSIDVSIRDYPTGEYFCIQRFNADGSLDASYNGNNGRKTLRYRDNMVIKINGSGRINTLSWSNFGDHTMLELVLFAPDGSSVLSSRIERINVPFFVTDFIVPKTAEQLFYFVEGLNDHGQTILIRFKKNGHGRIVLDKTFGKGGVQVRAASESEAKESKRSEPEKKSDKA